MTVTALYRLYDESGTLLYIGYTGSPPRRFEQHAKTKSWWLDVAYEVLTWYASRKRAAEAEDAAIKSEPSVHNVRGTPRWADVSRRAVETKKARASMSTASLVRPVQRPPAVPVLAVPAHRRELTMQDAAQVALAACREVYWEDQQAKDRLFLAVIRTLAP